MGRLINHYVDALARISKNTVGREANSSDSTDDWILEDHSTAYAYVRAFTSLAALLLLRCLTRIDNVEITRGVALFSAHPLIMQRLKEVLRAGDLHYPADMQGRFADARVYALFVGAWLEQARAAALRAQSTAKESSLGSDPGSHANSVLAEQGWFTSELAEQARNMNLYEWSNVRVVLLSYVYTDLLEPNAARWFPQTMNLADSSESASPAYGC